MHRQEKKGGGVKPNGAPTQTTLRKGQGGRDRRATAEVTLPRRTRAAVEARQTLTKGGTSTQMGQRVVNEDMRFAGGKGRRAQRGKAGEPVQKAHKTSKGR